MDPKSAISVNDFEDQYNQNDSPEFLMDALKKEFSAFEKPRSKTEAGKSDDLLRDIHRAIYGNGSPSSGLLWKTAEQTVLLTKLSEKHVKCRNQLVTHFKFHEQSDLEEQRGFVAFVKRNRYASIIVAVLLFFGVSSLYSILLQERQMNRVEEMVLSVVKDKLALGDGLKTN